MNNRSLDSLLNLPSMNGKACGIAIASCLSMFFISKTIKYDLFKFAEKDEHELISKAIKSGINPRKVNSFKETPLHVAARHAHINSLLALLPHSDKNASNFMGWTPIAISSLKGCHRCVEALLDSGASISAFGPFGITPLMLASMGGHEECVRILLPQSNCESETSGGRDIFSIVAQSGKTSIADKIVASQTSDNIFFRLQRAAILAREMGFIDIANIMDGKLLSFAERESICKAITSIPQNKERSSAFRKAYI